MKKVSLQEIESVLDLTELEVKKLSQTKQKLLIKLKKQDELILKLKDELKRQNDILEKLQRYRLIKNKL